MAGHKEKPPGKTKKRAGKRFWRDKPIASHRIFSGLVFGRPYLPLLVCCISVFIESDLRRHIVVAAGGGNAKSFAMMGGFLTRVSIMILGYAYPAYECYKTVELNRPEIEQLLFWCQYWILVAVLAVFERVGDALISWLPLYGEFKLIFFVYLWHPKTKGTTYIYSTFFQPYMSRHENKIDRTLLELRTRANDLATRYWQNVLSNGRSWFLTILQYAVSQPSSTTVHPVEEPRHAHHASTTSGNETEQPLASQQPKTEQTNPVLIQKPEKVKTDSSPISPSSALSKPVQVPASTRSSTSSHHPPPPPPHNEKLIQENLATTNNHNSSPHSKETKQEEPIRTVRRLRIKKRVATTASSVH